MKRTTALYAVTALAALSFVSQAFATGGSMGGGQGHGNTGGTHQMASAMLSASGNGMQQRSMLTQDMKQGGPGNSVGYQNGHMHGSGTGPTAQQPPVTSTAN